jgi:folate-binding protein YgfZ
MNPSSAQSPDWIAQYHALVERAALVDLGRRTQIELAGADRASFLHNLCTNEIRKLAVGSGCETFLTSVQGRTLAHVFVFAGPDSLVIDTVPGQGETILAHLDHYLVSEQVVISDRTAEWSEFFLAGGDSERILRQCTEARIGEVRLAHAPASVAGKTVWLRRADLAGPIGFLIAAPSGDIAAVRAALSERGAVVCSGAAFEAARVEWGFPLFGPDISDKNLPQEIARDKLAISFVKGCYLGQETVARIDALGHVNKTLVGVRFESSVIPQPGTQLESAEQSVGQITSAVYSPRLAAPLALAYMRRGSNLPGTRLTSAAGESEVVALPVR